MSDTNTILRYTLPVFGCVLCLTISAQKICVYRELYWQKRGAELKPNLLYDIKLQYNFVILARRFRRNPLINLLIIYAFSFTWMFRTEQFEEEI